VQFAVGEALVFAYGGLPLPFEAVLYSHFVTLGDCPQLAEKADAASGSDAVMQEAPITVSPFTGSDAGRKRILAAIFDETIFHSRVEVRCSGCIWLTNLLRFAGAHPSLAERLPEIHEALGQLLGDGNDLTQEMASRGMSLVYQLGDEDTRKQLVGALVGTLSGTATKKRRAVKVEGDTKVFEEGAMGATKDGKGLSTYQELCSLANEMGQPDLIYRFMDLANNQASMNTKRGTFRSPDNTSREKCFKTASSWRKDP
jgi:proteasome component ECM29